MSVSKLPKAASAMYDIVLGGVKAGRERLQRARDLDFNRDVYHSTYEDYDEIDMDRSGFGYHVGTPDQANNRSKLARGGRMGQRDYDSMFEGSRVMPLKLRTSGMMVELPDTTWENGVQLAMELRDNPQIYPALQKKIDTYLQEQFADIPMGSHNSLEWMESDHNKEMLSDLRNMLLDGNISTIKYKNQVENSLGREGEYSYIALDPSDVKSTFAQFKDGDSKNLLAGAKSIGIGTAFAGSMLAPEESEAGALSTVQNLIKLGFLTVESANNPSAVKSAITKYNKATLENPAFRAREKLRQDVENNTARLDVGERKIIAPHDLVGKTGVPIMGDATAIADVKSIGGVTFDEPAKLQGGAEFPMQQQDRNLGWASMKTAADKKQKNFEHAADKTESDVVGITGRMGDEATNFTSGVAETLFKQVQKLPIRKKDKKAFDEELRKYRPEWVGLDHPDAMDQLFGRNGYPMEGAGKLRTVFSNRMDLSRFRDLGFPTVREIHDEVMIPELRNANIGDSGFSVIETNPKASTKPIDIHDSYDTGIEGQYAGGFEVPIPARVMYPNMFGNYLDLAVDKRGAPLTESQKTGSMVMNPKLYQRLDNQWADGVQDFIDRYKKQAVAGGAVASSGGALADDQVPQEDGVLKDAADVALETTAGINRAVVDGLNFFTADQVNAVLNLMGSDKRMPTLYDVPYVKEATQGNFMDEGLPREIIRTGSGFLSPL